MAKLSKKAAKLLDERLNRHQPRKVIHTVTVLWHSGNQRYAAYVKVKGKKKHIAGGVDLATVEAAARQYAKEHSFKFREYQGRRPTAAPPPPGAPPVERRPGAVGPTPATRDPAPPIGGVGVATGGVVAIPDPDALIIRRK